MSLIQISALLLALITAIGWLNARTLRLAPSIAMLGAGLLSAGILLAGQTVIGPFWGFDDVRSIVKRLNFAETVLDYLLAFLLFAGGMEANLTELRRRRIAVWTLATVGVLVSTALVGFGIWAAAGAMHFDLPLAWALTFGALISPTDPIAVLGAVRSGAVSTRLGAVLQGEALFNDGVGLVAFTTALAFATQGALPHPLQAAGAILLEAGGGLALGLACAHATVFLLRRVEDRVVEINATLALAVGAYVLASLLHLSGPIAAAAAGLVMGEFGVKRAMGVDTRQQVEGLWQVIDQILSAMLFLLLGLQVFVLPFQWDEIELWLVAASLTMVGRLVVILPWGAYFRLRHEERGASLILTWGGLRGAVSLALALALPNGAYRDTLLGMTFFVVVISVGVQGLSFASVARRLSGSAAS